EELLARAARPERRTAKPQPRERSVPCTGRTHVDRKAFPAIRDGPEAAAARGDERARDPPAAQELGDAIDDVALADAVEAQPHVRPGEAHRARAAVHLDVGHAHDLAR